MWCSSGGRGVVPLAALGAVLVVFVLLGAYFAGVFRSTPIRLWCWSLCVSLVVEGTTVCPREPWIVAF
jgi:hypothetical protein